MAFQNKRERDQHPTAPEPMPLAEPRIHTRAALVATILWVALVIVLNRDVLVYSAKSLITSPEFLQYLGWPQLERGLPLLALTILFAAAWALGRFILARFFTLPLSLAEEAVYSVALGLGLISMAAFMLGVAGHFSEAQLRVFVAGSGIAGLALNRLLVPSRKPPIIAATPEFGAPAASCIIAGLVVMNFFRGLGPETQYDSLVYHLGLPKLYLIHGRIDPTPHSIYSGFPQIAEMLYGVGLALGGETAAKLIPWGVSLLVLGAIFTWVSRHASVTTGLLSAMAFYSLPVVSGSIAHCYVELLWCLFGFLALSVALSDKELSNKNIILVGIFLGLCAGTKYTAFAMTPLVIGIFLIKMVRGELAGRRFAEISFILFAVVGLFTAPWIIKNFVFYKNPVFPFFNDWFSAAPAGIDWRAFVREAGGRDFGHLMTKSGLVDLISPFWPRLITDDRMSLGYGVYFFVPLLFLWRPTSKTLRDLGIAAALAFLIWVIHTSTYRFFIFALPMIAIWIATAAASRRDLTVALIIACLLSSAQSFRLWQFYGTWKVVFGNMSKSEFLSREQPSYPTPPYAGLVFINENLPATAKILFLHESRAYHCERDSLAPSSFVENPIVAIANESNNGDDVAKKLRRQGITHLFINQMERHRLGADLPVTEKGKKALAAFFQTRVKLLFERKLTVPGSAQWVTVSEIL